jgi:hypothetical protein
MGGNNAFLLPEAEKKERKEKCVTKFTTSKTHIISENFLIQFDTNDSFKFKNSIENIKKPSFIITNLKLFKDFKKLKLSDGSKKMKSIPNGIYYN